MKVIFSTLILLISSFGFSIDYLNHFDCTYPIQNYGDLDLQINRLGNYHTAHLTLADETHYLPAVLEIHSAASAQRNKYASDLGNRLLEINWKKVQHVALFEVGNLDAEISAVGVNYIDAQGNLIAKGMYIGRSGALVCGTAR